MEVVGRLENLTSSLLDGKVEFSFSTDSRSAAEALEKLRDKELRIKVVQYRKKRSLSANALFWHCVGKIAEATGQDKWNVYLSMLRQYGKFTYICCHEEMVDEVRSQWRESMIWNSVDINGKPAVQMLCFFGSSSYNTKEMSKLIDGTISDMKELGLEPPMPQDIKVALENWENEHGQHIAG